MDEDKMMTGWFLISPKECCAVESVLSSFLEGSDETGVLFCRAPKGGLEYCP
jgi:hypothetical protein